MELVKNKETREPVNADKVFGLMTEMINKGILKFICGGYGNTFRFMPPLTTPKVYFEKAATGFLTLLKEKEKHLMV